MKKLLSLIIVALLIVPVMSQPLTTVKVPRIRSIIALGKGIAVSKEDPTDFEIVKVGIAKVKVGFTNKTKEFSIGVLWLGNEKYRIRKASVGNDTVEADVYSNNTAIGSIVITSVVKQKETVWVGELKVGEKEYNVYILEGIRKFKPVEVKESVSEYCKKHPVNCIKVAKGIATKYCSGEEAQTESCREKIAEYCKEHPLDQRCVVLKRAYCVSHPEDMRCREEMKNYCKKNPNDEKCKVFCKVHPLACGKISGEIKQLVRQKIKRAIQFGVKTRIKRLKTEEPLTPPQLPE